jgi:hydrogenase-4 component E
MIDHIQALHLAAGVFLLTAVGALWRRQLPAKVRLLVVQGVALAAMIGIIGAQRADLELLAVALGLGVLRAGVMPALIRRALVPLPQEQRETRSVVDVATSLLAAALLTLLAYAVTRPLVALDPTPITAVLPVAVAVVLIGFFTLTTRRRALSQMVGFLLLDNGITATAFLAAGGIPRVVEVGVSFDVLLIVLVLQMLTRRLRATVGTTDLNELRELRD